MNVEQFVNQFESAIEGIEPGSLNPEVIFRDLPQWESIAALTLLIMVNAEYGVTLTGNQLKSCVTLRDVYNLVASKTA